jgi:hypothetical protein
VTALNPNNTARYKTFYTVMGQQHDFQVRANAIFSPSTLGTFIAALFDALDPALYATTIDYSQYAASGSNVFNTVTTGAESSTYGSGAGSGLLIPQYIGFQGRSTGGHKVRLSIYGIKPEENDYRFNPADSAEVDAAIVVLNATANGALAIDGLKPLWYSYANTGFNAYWQRAQR